MTAHEIVVEKNAQRPQTDWETYWIALKVRSHMLKRWIKEYSDEVAQLEELIGIPYYATLQVERVRCGKAECKLQHGPYHYVYWKEDGKTRKKYIKSETLETLMSKNMPELVACYGKYRGQRHSFDKLQVPRPENFHTFPFSFLEKM